jgi:hypothetical protein
MKRVSAVIVSLASIAFGCGPSAGELREKTLSVLNTEADRWDGGQEFVTTANDAYGRPLTSHVEKTTLNYVLEVRSHGPDALPKNSDDIAVMRTKRHGETSVTEEAGKVTEALSLRAARGLIKGTKEGFGIGGGREKKD